MPVRVSALYRKLFCASMQGVLSHTAYCLASCDFGRCALLALDWGPAVRVAAR
jgi:hypothetical protein